MESYLKSNNPSPQVLPAPVRVPQPITEPQQEPNENDPFNVPALKVNPTPKGKKSF